MFDRVVCLLLDKRLGEQERVHAQFSAVGLEPTFFLAGDGSASGQTYHHIDVVPPPRSGYPAWKNRPNSWNAFLCFRKIVEKAKHDGVESLLLLEDDAEPVADFTPRFAESVRQLKEYDRGAAWRLLYLGANHAFSPTIRVAPNLLLLNGSGCWHAVALHRRVFDDVLALPMEDPIDGVCAKRIHPGGACYACWPNLVLPRPGFSYCEGRAVDYTDMFESRGVSW